MALLADDYKVPLLAPHVAAGLAATFEVGCSTLFLLTRGGGVISVDRFIGRYLQRR